MDAAHVWSVVLVVVVEAVFFAIGGDTIRAYLSDYEITSLASSMQSSTVAIRNVGLLQSADTLAVVVMNGTVNILDKMCPEGRLMQSDGRSLVVFFEHMTNGMPCVIDLHGAVVPQITLLTAKGLPGTKLVQGEGRSYGVWNLVILIGLIGQLAMLSLIIWISRADLCSICWSFRSKGYARTKNAINIAKCIKTVYGIKISHQKASVIEILMSDSPSSALISQRLSLPLSYVRILLRCLRDDDLVAGNAIDPSVREQIEKIIRPKNG